jgi:hypothetical protein
MQKRWPPHGLARHHGQLRHAGHDRLTGAPAQSGPAQQNPFSGCHLFLNLLLVLAQAAATSCCLTNQCSCPSPLLSQIWSFKLLRGFQKRQRRDRQLLSAKKKA